MALFRYLQLCRVILGDQDFATFNEDDLVRFINIARSQIAGQAECVRILGTLAVSGSSQVYPFTSINLGTNNGVQGALHVRQISYALGSGFVTIHPRAWPYFQTFVLGNVAPEPAAPNVWSQYAAGVNGSLYFNVLDAAYTCSCDTVCYPSDLATDEDVEAVPLQWTDAIPWFACSYALKTVGDKDRAEDMMKEYDGFMQRARGAATPAVLTFSYPQTGDPFLQNRLGLTQQRGQQ